MGDFRGLTEKLDYVAELGVNTIWLLPFYPSPLKDDGYDVADYRSIHPAYGTRADFHQFVREAHRRDLRVITELVVNHTSDQHPWFQAARRAPKGSRKRNWYVWSDDPKRYAGTRIIFTDTEKSNWTWDDTAQAYYWHRFFSHQPDLNFDNEQVRKAVFRTMRFWLDMGVDGFRLDAIPYLCEREGTNNENLPETHAVLRELRAHLDAVYPDRVLLAEANQWPEDVREYFGNDDECHMAYHFPLMPRMYMAMAQEDRHPIVEILQQTPEIPSGCQWAIFLRNHDELTLEMVTSRERDYMYQMYAADPRARINLGIRRRLAPLLDNDRDRIKLMYSLLLSMPGSPILYYGDEIGMGDNIYAGDRDGVRTPMQWQAERNGGFSRADPQRLYLQPIMDPVYGYGAVNVEAQLRDPSSLLHWIRRILAVRKASPVFGRGTLTFLRPDNRKILAYVREFGDDIVLCVANVGRTAQPALLDLGRFRGRTPVELVGRTAFPPIGADPYVVTLPGHGYLWFRLVAEATEARGGEIPVPPQELPVLVLFAGWESLFRERVVPWRIGIAEKVRDQLEREVLPAFVAKRRWFGGKGERLARVALADYVEWPGEGRDFLVTLVHVERERGERVTYFLPLDLLWGDPDGESLHAIAPYAIAKARRQAEVGVIADALGDEAFCRALLAAITAGSELQTQHGTIRFFATEAYARIVSETSAPPQVSWPAQQSSNTIVLFGELLFLKVYRRLQAGINPEVEVGRFLTERAGFAHAVPIAGLVEYRSNEGREATIAVLQPRVEHQGNGWDYTVNHLERHLEDVLARGADGDAAIAAGAHGTYLPLVRTLGRRTAEMHAAFASAAGDPAFDPEPLRQDDIAAWTQRVRTDATAALDRLAQAAPTLPGAIRDSAEGLVRSREALLERIDRHAGDRLSAPKTRLHGDFHLGQVLLARNDFLIIDFEGEPSRPLAERRSKHSPLRDIAGMLRSFDYAMHVALARLPALRAETAASVEQHARAWRDEAAQAFIAGYDEIARTAGLAPASDHRSGVLELFLIEKALYELRYETDHRPDWLHIPVRGLSDIVGARPRDG
jgi:maltose alpha-D-glucosyltransferase/alpha-amylase